VIPRNFVKRYQRCEKQYLSTETVLCLTFYPKLQRCSQNTGTLYTVCFAVHFDAGNDAHAAKLKRKLL
jgi:hypothetical protein